MPDAARDAIQTQALVQRFGTFTAVDGLDLAVPPGEIFGLLGSNGAGKSTTIEILRDLLAHRGVPREDARALHGHRAGADDAALLREQRHLPIAIMPPWLQAVSRANPLSSIVDALRTLMVVGGRTAFGLGADLAVMLVTLVALVAIASKLYPTVVR